MARHFISASDQRLETGSPPLTAAPLTMAAWIRSTNGSTFQRPLALGGGVNNEYYEFRLRGDTGGNLEFVSVQSGPGAAVISGSSYAAGVWFHYCALARGASDREAYKNGISFGTSLTANSPAILNMTIGILHAAGGWYNGLDGDMAEVGFWKVALTPNEISKLAAGAPCDAVRPASLVSYMRLDGDIVDRRGPVWADTGGSTAVSLFVPRRKLWRNYDANVVAGGGTVTGDGSSAGVGVATGIGAATAAATAGAAGVGTASATGAATAAGVGNAAGVGEALGVGAFTAGTTETGVASAAGVGTAAATGAGTAAGIGNAAGVGEALGVGAAIGIISAVGNAAGTSEALGYSPALLGGGEAGRGGKGGDRRRKRITWLPADYDIETGERRVPIAAETVASQPPSVKLSKGERKVARLLAQYRSRDDDTAERAREQLEALYQAQNSELARFIARQEQLDTQRRAAAAIAAEDDEAAVAFMQWLLRNP